MKRVLVLFFLFAVMFLPVSAASSVDGEIKKITGYAEDYETGNIDYAQLSVYVSAVRQRLNEILGAAGREEGGLLKEEQLKPILGDPNHETEWVWVENEERETKLENSVPVWEKIVFDGKKIQIRLNAFPSIFRKNNEESLIYRLHFAIEFKKPKDQFDIQDKISAIAELAKSFNSNPSDENAELLAKESVNAEKAFESFYRQNAEKCEDVMGNIFGTENIREDQKTIVQEANFFEGKNFDAILRLEMCDDCEWNWINLDFWINGRGQGFKPPKDSKVSLGQPIPKERLENMDNGDFENAIKNDIDQIKGFLEGGDYSKAMSIKNDLRQLNDAWNRKSNDIWKEVEKEFEPRRKSFEQSQNQEQYWWIKLDQERKQRERELRKQNYEIRKQFYSSLLSGYEKKEFYFTQVNYEKRLVEEYKEFEREICDNNNDDNKNGKIDCFDEQCSGKICGKQKAEIQEGNETKESYNNMYCIASTCQSRKEPEGIKKAACGNHVCEGNENTENCVEDCSRCKAHEPINCLGKVIFKGKDKNGCPLEPICLNEANSCEKNEDCMQPLCGRAECVESSCKVTGLEDCREEQCVDGEERTHNCESGDVVVVDKCINSIWIKTGLECAGASSEEPREPEEPVAGDECTVREDCGGFNDVCSNGRCVTIPEVIQAPSEDHREEQPPNERQQEEPRPEELSQETQEQQFPQEPVQEEIIREVEEQPESRQEQAPEQQQAITGQIIRTIKKVTELIIPITGFIVEGPEGTQTTQNQQQEPQLQEPQPFSQEETQEQQFPQEPVQETIEQPLQPEIREEPMSKEDMEKAYQDYGTQNAEKPRKDECGERCKRDCSDRLIAPCIGKCVWESECKELSCVEDQIKKCEESCKEEKSTSACETECSDKCLKGEEWQPPEEEMNKQEKGVFNAGGQCRTSQQKTEGFIYFNGWGDPFERIDPLKIKYYEGGNADWCKNDFENLKKQRQELEESFNQEFAQWFFEKYLANSADDWEQHASGIFEMFWRDVDISREMAYRMNCLETKELPVYKLIDIKYETDYGKLEFWEELKTVKMPGLEEDVQVISPYMKIWIFPPKQFIANEMKKAMQNHEFPGPPEEKATRKNEEGPTAEERGQIKRNINFMNKIRKFTEKYNGNADVVIQIKDYEKDEIVFNLYAQLNEQDIIKMKPMLPGEVPQQDIRIEIDFEKVYGLIYTAEKEMQGSRIESPPWDRKGGPVQMVKEAVNGVKMFTKMNDLINSAKIYPENEAKSTKDMMKTFFKMMMEKGPEHGPEQQQGNKEGQSKEKSFAK